MDDKIRDESLEFVNNYLNEKPVVKNYPKWARIWYFWLGVACKSQLRRMKMKELDV